MESFCGEPWNNIEVDPQGDFKICCLANLGDYGMAHDKDGKIMHILTHSFKEAQNSETHKSHRLELSNNIKPKRCRNCYDAEDVTKGYEDWGSMKYTGRSKRQRIIKANPFFSDKFIVADTASEYTEEDGSTSVPLLSLDVRFGNLCNYKCIMCSPEFSSLWYEDWTELAKVIASDPLYAPIARRHVDPITKEPIRRKSVDKVYTIYKDEHSRYKMKGMDPWWENPIWWEKFDEIAPDLRKIYFTGGEPFLVPAMHECVDRLIALGNADKMQLLIDTNLSVLNKPLLEKFKKFKKLLLCVSLDDTEDRFNLIRNPGNYETVYNNLVHLKENNIPIFYVSACIGVASIFTMKRVLEVADGLGIDANFRFLEGPSFLDLRILPSSMKQEIIDTLEKECETSPSHWHKWFHAEINLLKKYMDVNDYTQIRIFVRLMDKLDELRGTNWKVTLDDVYDLLSRHCPIVFTDEPLPISNNKLIAIKIIDPKST